MKNKVSYIYRIIDNASDSEASYCGDCKEYLGSYPAPIPKICPKCKAILKEIGNIRIT